MYVTRKISALAGGLLYCHTAHGFRSLRLATFPLPSSAHPTLYKLLTPPAPALLQWPWRVSGHSFSSCRFEIMSMWFFIHVSFKTFVCAKELIQRFTSPSQGVSTLVQAKYHDKMRRACRKRSAVSSHNCLGMTRVRLSHCPK